MNKTIITNLAQASIAFLRALADALNDTPEAAAMPPSQAADEPAPKKRGPKPKAETTKEPEADILSTPIELLKDPEPTIPAEPKEIDKMTTEERFLHNQQFIAPCVKARPGLELKQLIGKHNFGGNSSRTITAETQAAFEADIKEFMEKHGIKMEPLKKKEDEAKDY